MKVALYHPWIYLKGGIERTILELTGRSRHDWTIFTNHFAPDRTFPELRERRIVELPLVSVDRSHKGAAFAAARIAGTKLDLDGYQSLVVCCDGLGSLINFRNSGHCPVTCLCFTPLRVVYDAHYRARHLDQHPRIRTLWPIAEHLYKLVDRLAWRRYRQVFCISETVRRRVAAGRLYPYERMGLLHPGIDGAEIAPHPHREPILLLPGRIMWTKDLELGISSFIRFKDRRGGPWRLVIAGMVDAKSQTYLDSLHSLAQGREDIEFILDLSDHELRLLYQSCFAVLFTAFNEDWGLTPLEAMRFAKPVLAVDRGGPTEVVVHDRTGYLSDNNTQAFADCLERLTEDPDRAAAMGLAGSERVRLFTWERFVETLDTRLEVAGDTR